MDPQNNIIEPTNKSHRLIYIITAVIVSAGVVGGSIYYVLSKNINDLKKENDRKEAAQKAELSKVNKTLEDKEKELALLNGEVVKTKEEITKSNEEKERTKEVDKVLTAFLEAKKDKNYKVARSYMSDKVAQYTRGDQSNDWTEDSLKNELEFGLQSYAVKEAGTFPTATTYKVVIREEHISQPTDPNEMPVSYNLDITVTLVKKDGSWKIDGYMVPGGMGKPVVYLYPEKDTLVSVLVRPDGGITKSEPEYGQGWNVLAKKGGELVWNGQKFPYLFWEGNTFELNIPEDGFVVKKVDVSKFLDKKLKLLGMNKKETADFKEFWVPRMQEKPYYFVNFIPQEEIDRIAPLDINPKPETTIRVLMNYKSLDEKVSVSEQKLTKVKRKGYTAVEWGGIFGR